MNVKQNHQYAKNFALIHLEATTAVVIIPCNYQAIIRHVMVTTKSSSSSCYNYKFDNVRKNIKMMDQQYQPRKLMLLLTTLLQILVIMLLRCMILADQLKQLQPGIRNVISSTGSQCGINSTVIGIVR